MPWPRRTTSWRSTRASRASRRARADPAGAAGGDRQLGRRDRGRAGGDHRGLPAGRALRPRARPRAGAGLRRPHARRRSTLERRPRRGRRARSPRRWRDGRRRRQARRRARRRAHDQRGRQPRPARRARRPADRRAARRAQRPARQPTTATPFSHACVARRMLEDPRVEQVLQLGVRSVDAEEVAFARASHERVRVWYAEDVHDGGWREEFVARVRGRRVHLTIDVDGLDPAIVPGDRHARARRADAGARRSTSSARPRARGLRSPASTASSSRRSRACTTPTSPSPSCSTRRSPTP